MQDAKQLFHSKTPAISVDIWLGFEGDDLVLDGYDLGQLVDELRGDSDYEYTITVSAADLEQLYALHRVAPGQRTDLVEAIAEKINGNKSFSLFREYLKENQVPFKTWTY
ncbi:MAG TPA: hypothetical protein VL547_05970 [Dinghuibacter sp.]|uniref:hypothetical protein n=1 Tax=Dinghuibacter sp. TaxID=2024697 RepID=UPI002BA9EE2F|nr:hypothetical protein [Dinghuibacter sp.]HTJ11547.1 hypothetical protein [Dinghuibacter sp.]